MNCFALCVYAALQVMDMLTRVLRSSIMHLMDDDRQHRVAFLDSKFVAAMNRTFPKFCKSLDKAAYMFPTGLRDMFPTSDTMEVPPTRYYFPFFAAKNHWVGICFDASEGVLTVLDSNNGMLKDNVVEKKLKPIVLMLPYLARFACQLSGDLSIIHCFDVVRPKSVEQITKPADSGLMALLLMGRHAIYGMEACKNITSDVLAAEGKRAAILTYEFKEKL